VCLDPARVCVGEDDAKLWAERWRSGSQDTAVSSSLPKNPSNLEALEHIIRTDNMPSSSNHLSFHSEFCDLQQQDELGDAALPGWEPDLPLSRA